MGVFTTFWRRVPPSAPGQRWFVDFVATSVQWQRGIGECGVQPDVLETWLQMIPSLTAAFDPNSQVSVGR